jgi:excisionase family DNA binding protein
MKVQSPLNEYLTVNEAAQFLKYTPRTLRTMKSLGRVPYHKLNGRVFFKKSELEKWLFEGYKYQPVKKQ